MKIYVKSKSFVICKYITDFVLGSCSRSTSEKRSYQVFILIFFLETDIFKRVSSPESRFFFKVLLKRQYMTFFIFSY